MHGAAWSGSCTLNTGRSVGAVGTIFNYKLISIMIMFNLNDRNTRIIYLFSKSFVYRLK